MNPFEYVDGELRCEGVSLSQIVAEAGSPVYIYSANAMRARLRAYQDAFGNPVPLFCYALKANHNISVIKLFRDAGAGADTVSAGEIQRALAAGMPPKRIVFAGVAKGDDEIAFALEQGIFQFNVESVPELERLSVIASLRGQKAPVALRVNPDVEAKTHAKISTGRKADKFGIAIADAMSVYRKAEELPGIDPVGLHLHIGSQITELSPFAAAYSRSADLFRALRAEGHNLTRLDLGGGFGVRYRDEEPLDPLGFAALVEETVGGLNCQLMFEPGRALVAEAGVMVATSIYRKINEDRQFLILDAGMNTLVRPAMYDAYHEIVPVRLRPEPSIAMDVVGPICESSDVFGRARLLPPLEAGDLVAFKSAGAYGHVMSSDYNSRTRAAEVLVDGAKFAVIKPGVKAEEQFADELIPDWLN